MALIQCGECDNQVSDKAACCPKCGAPISTAHEIQAIGTPTSTIQETSKRLKTHSLIATIMIIVGFIWLIGSSNANHG